MQVIKLKSEFYMRKTTFVSIKKSRLSSGGYYYGLILNDVTENYRIELLNP